MAPLRGGIKKKFFIFSFSERARPPLPLFGGKFWNKLGIWWKKSKSDFFFVDASPYLLKHDLRNVIHSNMPLIWPTNFNFSGRWSWGVFHPNSRSTKSGFGCQASKGVWHISQASKGGADMWLAESLSCCSIFIGRDAKSNLISWQSWLLKN